MDVIAAPDSLQRGVTHDVVKNDTTTDMSPSVTHLQNNDCHDRELQHRRMNMSREVGVAFSRRGWVG